MGIVQAAMNQHDHHRTLQCNCKASFRKFWFLAISISATKVAISNTSEAIALPAGQVSEHYP
jgi:hypothetical protein